MLWTLLLHFGNVNKNTHLHTVIATTKMLRVDPSQQQSYLVLLLRHVLLIQPFTNLSQVL